jgi:hypothetical protein
LSHIASSNSDRLCASVQRLAVQLQARRRVGVSILHDIPAAGLTAATACSTAQRKTVHCHSCSRAFGRHLPAAALPTADSSVMSLLTTRHWWHSRDGMRVAGAASGETDTNRRSRSPERPSADRRLRVELEILRRVRHGLLPIPARTEHVRCADVVGRALHQVVAFGAR